MKEKVMGGQCGTHEKRRENHARFWWCLEDKDYSEDTGLKCIHFS
jgi:hypothetical protein